MPPSVPPARKSAMARPLAVWPTIGIATASRIAGIADRRKSSERP